MKFLKSNWQIYSVFCLILSLNLSCHKIKSSSPFSRICCTDYIDDSPFSQFIYSGVYFKAPCYNPNNSDEFVFYFLDLTSGTRQLIKYNTELKQKTILANNVRIIGQPKWSNKGWIAFSNQNDYNIWIVKENGDSLTKFTTSNANLDPTWSSDGNTLYWSSSQSLGFPYYLLSQDVNFTNLDSILGVDTIFMGVSRNNDISINNQLIATTEGNTSLCLAKADLLGKQFSFSKILEPTIINFGVFGSNSGLCWSHDGSSIYFSGMSIKSEIDGIIKLNIQTGNLERIKAVCNRRFYDKISSSKDGNYLLVECTEQNPKISDTGTETGDIVVKSSIWSIDLQTLKETKINLD